jgi:hypothetical protein
MMICWLRRAGGRATQEKTAAAAVERPAMCDTFYAGAVISRSDELLLLLHASVFWSIYLSCSAAAANIFTGVVDRAGPSKLPLMAGWSGFLSSVIAVKSAPAV